MYWKDAPDIKRDLLDIVPRLSMKHINIELLICFRSFGSKSLARARIWSLPRVWQKALNVQPHYIIEVLSEKFDRLSPADKKRVLIHELMHIPKNFSGSLIPHRGRGRHITNREVEKLFALYCGSSQTKDQKLKSKPRAKSFKFSVFRFKF